MFKKIAKYENTIASKQKGLHPLKSQSKSMEPVGTVVHTPASVRRFSSNWSSIKFLKDKPNEWTASGCKQFAPNPTLMPIRCLICFYISHSLCHRCPVASVEWSRRDVPVWCDPPGTDWRSFHRNNEHSTCSLRNGTLTRFWESAGGSNGCGSAPVAMVQPSCDEGASGENLEWAQESASIPPLQPRSPIHPADWLWRGWSLAVWWISGEIWRLCWGSSQSYRPPRGPLEPGEKENPLHFRL